MRPVFRPFVLALPLVAAACGSGPDPRKTAAPVPVSAFTVGAAGQGPGTGDDGTTFAAVVRRDREATLSFRVGGTLADVPVRIGQELPAGTLVAAVDATPYRAGAARAAAEVDRLARAADRYGGLVAAGAVADAQARDTRDGLAGARAALAAARYDVASARLVMPFRGVVITRQVERGETVAPGQPVATVADLSAPLLAAAQVADPVARRLRTGQDVTVTAAGLAPLAARVLRVAGGSDPRTGTVAVEVALPAGARLASGTPVAVRIRLPQPDALQEPAATIAIPGEALLGAQGSRASVFVIDARGRARRRVVGFHGFADQSARVSGLAPGTRVITAGAGFVAEGDAVTVSGA